jgi:hypothetical protein
MDDILQEILKSQAHVVAGLFVLWLLIGIGGGLLLGGGAGLALSKLGAMRLEWKHARWLRALSVLWLVGSFGFLGGALGGCEGTLRGTERVVRQSQVRTEGLRRAGEYVSASVVYLDFAIRGHEERKDIALRPEDWTRIEAFTLGKAEFDVRAFRARLDRVEAEFVSKIVGSAKEDLRKNLKIAPGGVAERMLDAALPLLARHGLRKTVGGKLEDQGLTEGVDRLFGALDAAARAAGSPDTAAHAELTEEIVERCLIPLVLIPARSIARGQQLTSLLLMAAALALPVAGFAFGRRLERRSPKSVDTAPPASDAPGTPAGGKGGGA